MVSMQPPSLTSAQALMPLPERLETEAELDELLTRPRPVLVGFVRTLSSPLVVLGAGGKMGPTLAVLARRAAEAARHPLEVVAVSRFGDGKARAWLEERGVQTRSCDLLDREQVSRLPESENVVYLVGLKFGTSEDPASTWAVNTLVPALVVERYGQARIAALSTGNVYPLSSIAGGGARESHPLTPLGEYSNAAVARERIFEFASRRKGARLALLRLFYACELRYGVLLDLARKVHRGESVDLANGRFNCIWQGDANEMALRALALASSPPSSWNLCRPEVHSVRDVAVALGRLLHCEPHFLGVEAETALIGDASRIRDALGTPAVELETMLRWVAHWVSIGGRELGKPTHFEVRDGRY